METWRNEINEEIDRINQVLLDTPASEKAEAIQEWIESVLDRMEYYKAEHQVLLKEVMTLLELALWKARRLGKEENDNQSSHESKAKKAKVDVESARMEHRVTCGADIVIKNVLPFLALE